MEHSAVAGHYLPAIIECPDPALLTVLSHKILCIVKSGELPVVCNAASMQSYSQELSTLGDFVESLQSSVVHPSFATVKVMQASPAKLHGQKRDYAF